LITPFCIQKTKIPALLSSTGRPRIFGLGGKQGAAYNLANIDPDTAILKGNALPIKIPGQTVV